MEIHKPPRDKHGIGKWDLITTRYIPLSGGSRSRLPVYDDPEQRRYPGFVGFDEFLTPDIHILPVLYQYLGGKPLLQEGDAGKFTALLLGQTMERLEAADAALPDMDLGIEEDEEEENNGD